MLRYYHNEVERRHLIDSLPTHQTVKASKDKASKDRWFIHSDIHIVNFASGATVRL